MSAYKKMEEARTMENSEKFLREEFMENRPIRCKKCGGKLFYTGSGTYTCEDCEHIMLDDFGKVKAYLEEHGPTPMAVIAQDTGVEPRVIEFFLKKGRVEIIEGSNFYINCEKCGCSIRYGRYCPECVKQLAGGIKAVFHEDMGERPKSINNDDMKGTMHFLKRGKK